MRKYHAGLSFNHSMVSQYRSRVGMEIIFDSYYNKAFFYHIEVVSCQSVHNNRFYRYEVYHFSWIRVAV